MSEVRNPTCVRMSEKIHSFWKLNCGFWLFHYT